MWRALALVLLLAASGRAASNTTTAMAHAIGNLSRLEPSLLSATITGLPLSEAYTSRDWVREARAESSALWYWLRDAAPLATKRLTGKGTLSSEEWLSLTQQLLQDWLAASKEDEMVHNSVSYRDPWSDLGQVMFFAASARVAQRLATRSLQSPPKDEM